MIVIGASLGGMKALKRILHELPSSFPLPVAAVLHRHKESDDSLPHLIQMDTRLTVSEALDKQPILAGCVWLAPADYHLLVEQGYFSLSTDEPVQFARPSIDVLFESAADVFGAEVIGIVLTGANQDGARGAARIQSRGGVMIVEDPETAECAIMPQAALVAARPQHVCRVEGIGPLLLRLAASRLFYGPPL